jgi:hypothetical protein
MYKDPFKGGDNFLILTESLVWKDDTYTEKVPANTNFRYFASKLMD